MGSKTAKSSHVRKGPTKAPAPSGERVKEDQRKNVLIAAGGRKRECKCFQKPSRVGEAVHKRGGPEA